MLKVPLDQRDLFSFKHFTVDLSHGLGRNLYTLARLKIVTYMLYQKLVKSEIFITKTFF